MATYTFSGKTYDSTDLLGSDGRGYDDPTVTGTGETGIPLYVAPMIDALADLANAHITTSVSSVLIGLGSKTFVLAADIPLVTGERGVAIDTVSSANKVYFEVTSYTSATKTAIVNVDAIEGSGTKTSWDFVGKLGATGVTGSGISNVVDDTTPQLGGNLDVNGKTINSVSNGDINIVPNGTGKINVQDKQIQRPILIDYAETQTTPASSAGTLTTDIVNGNVFEVTLTENVTTWTISNPVASGDASSFTLILKAGTGGFTFAFPASVDWAGGTAPSLTTTASAVDVLVFTTTDGGTTWLGFAAGLDVK